MTDSPLTRHVVRAALHVAAVLGDASTPVVVARDSYWRRATGGIFSSPDLVMAENILVDAGFVLRDDDVLTITPGLYNLLDVDEGGSVELLTTALLGRLRPTDPEELAAVEETIASVIDDPARREALLLALGRRWDDQHRQELGAIGEEVVAAFARAELLELGQPELAAGVRRVSLLSDQFGYDVVAPRLGGRPRLLEVKASTVSSTQIYLSRNEVEVAQRFGDWAMVHCRIDDVATRAGSVLGWCAAAALVPFLPADRPGGRWESVSIDIDGLRLHPGLPRPTA